MPYALTIFVDENTKKNFSKENMTTWFKANKDKNFNLIFSSQDAAYEAIATYRTAMLADLGVGHGLVKFRFADKPKLLHFVQAFLPA